MCESVQKLPSDWKNAYPETEWTNIAGFRNRCRDVAQNSLLYLITKQSAVLFYFLSEIKEFKIPTSTRSFRFSQGLNSPMKIY